MCKKLSNCFTYGLYGQKVVFGSLVVQHVSDGNNARFIIYGKFLVFVSTNDRIVYFSVGSDVFGCG